MKRHFLPLLLILLPLLGPAAERMGNVAGRGRDLTFYDAPHWVSITIPESRDTFQNHVTTEASPLGPGRRAFTKIAFTPPGGGPPYSSMVLYAYDRYSGNDNSVTLPISPTPKEFVTEYKAHWAHFFPSLAPAQLEAENVSALRFGDRTWFRYNKWGYDSRLLQYATIIDEKKMLVFEWRPPRDTFFRRNRAAKKQLEIEAIVASVRLSKDP